MQRNHLEKETKMPGNTVRINNSDDLEWDVSDKYMVKLIKWLNEYGSKTNDDSIKAKARSSIELFDKGLFLRRIRRWVI